MKVVERVAVLADYREVQSRIVQKIITRLHAIAALCLLGWDYDGRELQSLRKQT